MTFACIIPAMFLSEFELAPNIVITSLFHLNTLKVPHASLRFGRTTRTLSTSVHPRSWTGSKLGGLCTFPDSTSCSTIAQATPWASPMPYPAMWTMEAEAEITRTWPCSPQASSQSMPSKEWQPLEPRRKCCKTSERSSAMEGRKTLWWKQWKSCGKATQGRCGWWSGQSLMACSTFMARSMFQTERTSCRVHICSLQGQSKYFPI